MKLAAYDPYAVEIVTPDQGILELSPFFEIIIHNTFPYILISCNRGRVYSSQSVKANSF